MQNPSQPSAQVLTWPALLLMCAASCWLHALTAHAQPSKNEQRNLFLQAEKLWKRGDAASYERVRGQLADYPLLPYLELAETRAGFAVDVHEPVDEFLQRFAKTSLERQLRGSWLAFLARRGQWGTFIEYYRPGLGRSTDCHHAHALLRKKNKKAGVTAGLKLWRYGKSLPDACDPVIVLLDKLGKLNSRQVWARIELAMQSGQTGLAKYLARRLPKSERATAQQWRSLHGNPAGIAVMSRKHERPSFTLTRYAFRRLSRGDGTAAREMWDKFRAKHTMPPEVAGAISADIALGLALDHEPEATEFMASLDEKFFDTRLRAWRVRSAIRQSDWRAVINAVAKLEPEERQKPRWRYWRARAQEALGQRASAERGYAVVAENREFYGFLAADKLNLPYKLNHVPVPRKPETLQQLSTDPTAKRVMELLALERFTLARREWFGLMRTLPKDDVGAAAYLASRWSWASGAILTLGRARLYGDVELRFPLTHKTQIERHATRWEIPVPWAFAVVRQESAFMANARSPVGARGLMQIMPATGRQIARRLKVRYRGAKSLYDPERNVFFGTSYLRYLSDSLARHPALATAGYNAGPHRARRWLPDTPLASDQWIETIPFKETRKYVRRVMAYEAIYRARLGLAQVRLTDRLPFVPDELAEPPEAG